MAKILIADDRATDRLFLVTLLGYQGHVLLEASNGTRSLQLVQSERPDLVICDLLMPGMDGFEFLRRLRADPAVAHTPVIFYTGTYTSQDVQALAEEAGVTRRLLKPSEPEVILEAVAEALGTKVPDRPLTEEYDRKHLQVLNEKLYAKAEQLELTNRRLAALLDVGRHLAGEHDPRRLVDHVCAVARDILGAGAAVVGLLGEDAAALRYFSASGAGEGLEEAMRAAGLGGQSLLRSLLDDRRPRRLKDEGGRRKDEQEQTLFDSSFLPHPSSFLGVPVASPARAHGWLLALNKVGAEEFSAVDEQLAMTLAAQVAVSYENALRYERIEQQADALRAEVAERKRAEEEVRRQREWLQVTLSSIGDAVIATDNQGRVLFMNGVAEQLTAWHPTEAAGRPLHQVFRIVNEHTRAVVENPVEKVLRLGVVQGLANHTVLIARDGSERPIDDCAAPIRANDQRTQGVVLIFHDVSDRRQLENQLRERAERLAEADRRKTQFLAMLAHELRNPLAPLRNGLHILQVRGSDPPTLERVRAMMDRQVRHMTRMIDDLLDVSRLTRGKVSLQQERLDLARLVRLCAEDHKPALAAAGIALQLQVPETPVWALGDEARLTQVFSNLLDNARKFTPGQGRVDLRLSTEEGQAVVAISDTGVGITPEELPHIFEPFAQADQSLDRSMGGLGLGLALVKGLVGLHRGTIEASSAGKGKGATFVVRLPLQGEQAPESGTPAPAEAAVRPLRVLVIEDQEDAAESLRLLLEILGHEVKVAHTGPAGVEAGREMRPDVVICDIGLPGMDGFKVAAALRMLPETADTRLLAVTGYGQEEDRRRALEAGFDGHLVKPVDPEKLLALLEAGPRSDPPGRGL